MNSYELMNVGKQIFFISQCGENYITYRPFSNCKRGAFLENSSLCIFVSCGIMNR